MEADLEHESSGLISGKEQVMAYSPTMMRFAQQDPAGYVDGLNDYQFVADNPINGLDSSGTTRYVFVFEGLWGYGKEGWNDILADGAIKAGHGGNILKILFGEKGKEALANLTPGGSDSAPAGAGSPYANDTVVAYYHGDRDAYAGVESAMAYANAAGIGSPHKTAGLFLLYDTVVVLGHSFGGDAAWEFASRMKRNGFTVNLGITFDPRSQADNGGSDDHASWKVSPAMPARSWVNYYRPNDCLLRGYELPKPTDNRKKPVTLDHSGMIGQFADQWLEMIKQVPLYKLSRG
jgi:RHS repeat-associated protein